MSHATRTTKSLLRRTLWWGFAASLLLHAGLLAVMVFGTVRGWLNERPLLVVQASSTYASRAVQERAIPATVMINEDDPAPTGIQKRFEESLAATEHLTEAERIEALDAATNRLNRISSEASIDDVATRLQSLFGLTPRAENPVGEDVAVEGSADPPSPDEEGEFDFETAQLHDVRRVTATDSRPKYLCVLLDARGRTIEVPMSEAEGEPIYSLMEKIKASPLLEQIYRQLAMPLLDQMVKAERATAAARNAGSKNDVAEAAQAVPTVEPSADEGVPDDTVAPR